MKKWECAVCGFIYDEKEGLSDEGIEAGTEWHHIADNWECPQCGAEKSEFVEI